MYLVCPVDTTSCGWKLVVEIETHILGLRYNAGVQLPQLATHNNGVYRLYPQFIMSFCRDQDEFPDGD